MKKVAVVFFSAFILNVVWENLHSLLYANYQGGTITEFILLQASLFDAIVITILVLPFLYHSFLRRYPWLILVFGTVVAVANEWYGLGTGRWLYNSAMPILPVIHLGLSPVIQLGLSGYVSYLAQARMVPPEDDA